MARVSYVEKSQAAPEALEVYEEFEAMGVPVLNVLKAMAHSPKLLKAWWRMMATALNDLELDPKLRELALLRLFKITGCRYCSTEHDRIALREGLTRAQIDEIENWRESDAYDELQKLVLRYTETITADNRVEDEVFAKLGKHLSERELVELTFCIANWNSISRFIVPIGLELETPADK